MSTPTFDEVKFCLSLYEQRRDPALREARDWMSAFTPASFDDIKAVMTGAAGPDANRCWRQAGSYWEMIAALMNSGGVSDACRELFVKTTREFIFHFSKIEPFLPEIRAFAMPTAFKNLEEFCVSLPEYVTYMTYFKGINQKRLADKSAAAKSAKKPVAKKKAPAKGKKASK